jgi:hypothetical protein
MNSHFELLLFALLALVFYSLLRLAFSKPSRSLGDDASPDLRFQGRFDHTFVGASEEQRKRDEAPVSDDLGRVRVVKFNFEHFDAVPGPVDPECFADELILELYDSVSDFRWTVSYVIATPKGISKRMDDEDWNFLYATEIFLVRRYDLELIRRAVYGRIKELHDSVALDPEQPPMRA